MFHLNSFIFCHISFLWFTMLSSSILLFSFSVFSSSPILKVLLFSLVSTLLLAMILSNKLTVYSEAWFSETLTLLFFSFMFLDLLVPKVVLAEFIKSLLSFSIEVSSSADDKFFGLRLFTKFLRRALFFCLLHLIFCVSRSLSWKIAACDKLFGLLNYCFPFILFVSYIILLLVLFLYPSHSFQWKSLLTFVLLVCLQLICI